MGVQKVERKQRNGLARVWNERRYAIVRKWSRYYRPHSHERVVFNNAMAARA